MNLEEAAELAEAGEEQGSRSNRWKEKQKFLKALQLASKYYDDIDLTAEHDEIWIDQQREGLKIEVWSEEDIKEMGRLGWTIDMEVEAWHRYV